MTRHEQMRRCFDRRRALLEGLAKIDGELDRHEAKRRTSLAVRARIVYLQGKRRWYVRELASVALRYVELARAKEEPA